eukprot:CCRYP_017340-RA/>CCRYP_017340-RA protein AED:0.12 eAED:0.12 QI:70/1/1/1/0.85/0.62/8/1082/1108
MNAQSLAAMIDLGLGPGSEKKGKKKKPSAPKQPKQTQPLVQQQQQPIQHHHHQQQQQPQSIQHHHHQQQAPQQHHHQQGPQQTPRTTSTAEALLNMSAFTGGLDTDSYPGTTESDPYLNSSQQQEHQHQQQLSHGFVYPVPSSHDPTSFAPNTTNSGISIKAPTHEDMISAGKFPEPSPAACGKRKVAEIAAAQMLVGVTGGFSPNHIASTMNKRPSIGGAAAAAQDVLDDNTHFSSSMPFQSDDDAFLAEVFGVDDGRATPPPHDNLDDTGMSIGFAQMSAGRGMSLQILNPDSLVDDEMDGMHKRRFMNGQASPSTPWDGQLEALVSHVHRQEENLSYESTINYTEDPIVADQNTTSPEITVPKPNPVPLPLRNPRSELQHAICNASVHEVSQIIVNASSNAAALINERDDDGYHALHSSSALGILDHLGPNCEESVEICRLLLDAGADVMWKDKDGNAPVHWAARAGHCGVLELLLLKNCPIDSQNDVGETALHWAMRSGAIGMAAVQFLVESGARTNLYSRNYKRPLDVAAEGFANLKEDGDENENNVTLPVDQRERRTTRWNMLNFSSQCRTLVLHHHECLDHMTKSDHDWEVPDRIDSIMSTLASRTFDSCSPDDEYNFNSCEITVSNEFERATLELLSRIHSADYLAFVNELSKELDRKRKKQLLDDAQHNSSSDPQSASEKSVHVVPFTPMIQRKFIKETMAKADGHSDTSFSAGSLKAARRAAGAVQHAVDCVLVGRNRNAFCVIRPPGHHAGINGLLSNAESCGFCLFNNVAAGAMHALSDEKHRPRCERCAIVDIDAHHGNGTEEIVRKCHDSGRLLFFSVHLYDYDKPKKGSKEGDFQYKFYPGTGADDDVAHNVINVPIAPLWREKEVIRSITSSSLNGTTHISEPRQTRQKTKAEMRVASSSDLKNIAVNDPLQQTNMKSSGASVGSESAASENTPLYKQRPHPPSSSNYPPHFMMGVGRLAYRRAIQHRLLPALRAFNPDLIIMSTGFDAARGDVGNARHFVNGTEAMGLDLEPEDYAWTSRKICEIADICCNGRVVSVLEGGYGRTPPPIPPPPLADTVESESVRQPLEKSFFSECAIHHLKGLIDPYCGEK